MERRELARLLGATTNAVTPSGPRLVSSSSPTEFMAQFAAAVAGGGEVFLGDPHWGATEVAQRATILAAGAGTTSDPERGWLMIPTGGSSGGLKFARHDQATIHAAVAGFSRHFGLARVNAVGLLPLHHVSGFMAWMRCLLTGGRYAPADWKRLQAGELPMIGPEADWVISLVPTQLQRLLEIPAAVDWLRGFRVIFLGGGPAWAELLERAAAARLPLSLSYGMTETAAMVTALRPEEFAAGARSSGAALPHATVRVTEPGLVAIAGESLFRGYYPAWREAGAFTTSDRGQLDATGRLTILGRDDQVIISGGEKIQPAEVEAALRATGEFEDVAVVGLPDARWGAVVVAVHPAGRAPDVARVGRELAGRLAAFKVPKHFLALGEWPRNAAGKLDRAELAHLAEICLRNGGN